MQTITKHNYCYSDGVTHPGLVRKINEDALLNMPQQGIWAVADGMGGHNAGDIASNALIDALRECALHEMGSNPIIEVQQATHQVNQLLRQYSKEHLDGNVVGTTVVILVAVNGHFHAFWAGDSRMYMLRNDVFKQITRDHSEVADMVESGLIKAEEAEDHPLANVVTRAVGGDDVLELDYVYGKIEAGDQFLICTDGITKVVSDDELAEAMALTGLSATNQMISELTLSRNAPDNFTNLLVKFPDEIAEEDITIQRPNA